MAHLGKRGAGALAVSNLIGRLSGAVEDLIRGGGESLRKRRARGSTPQDILESDKDNFEIRYEEIVEVSLDELNGTVSITVLTRQEKFRFFSPGMTLRKVEALFRKTLGDKITVGKLG